MTSVMEYHFRGKNQVYIFAYKFASLKEISMCFKLEECGAEKNWADLQIKVLILSKNAYKYICSKIYFQMQYS